MNVIVDVDNTCPNLWAPETEVIKNWVYHTLESASKKESQYEYSASIGIRIVNEEESARLNGQYRGKDRATNVLSFSPEIPEQFLNAMNDQPMGDLAICASVVSEEARAQDKSTIAHWAHMVVHGILHLRGYDHVDEEEATLMEEFEIQILHQLGYNNPYDVHPAQD